MKKIVLLFLFNAVIALNCVAADWTPVSVSSRVTHVQPMTGLVLWPEEAAKRYSTYGESHALEYSYVAPCKVVVGCAEDSSIIYDWSYMDNLLDDIKSRNHQAVIRFFYEYPGVPMVDDNPGTTGVPAYIKALDDYDEICKDVKGDGKTCYAGWGNKELKRFTKLFYTDFAKRYEKDPRIAFVEVGFGHWSEYHMYDDNGVDLRFGVNFPTKDYQKEFFLHLSKVMGSIPWAISIDAADDEYTPFADDKQLRKLDFGLFDDSFMHEGHEKKSKDGYNEECWETMGSDRWKTGVCGGEISYYEDSDQLEFTNPKGMYGYTWENQSSKYHITFMIANDNPSGKKDYNKPSRFKECSMATGYHFVVTGCQTDGAQTKITVTNTGVAPLYRDAYFAVGSTRSEQSLRGLLPKESMEVIIDAPLACDGAGRAIENPVIACDYILDTQTIEYDCDIATTGSELVKQSSEEDGQRYDILGKKVSEDQRGLVIVKGKKVYYKDK
ncbi:MAG: hypothetical protein IKN77_12190 [Paludibacteraceae bacterium]|nr:hypothetical protein [Paludibacteraceae bacterium]